MEDDDDDNDDKDASRHELHSKRKGNKCTYKERTTTSVADSYGTNQNAKTQLLSFDLMVDIMPIDDQALDSVLTVQESGATKDTDQVTPEESD